MEEDVRRIIDNAVELQKDRRNRKIVKAVLFFSFLVVGAISIYTTYLVFSGVDGVAFSPEDFAALRNESGNQSNLSEGSGSFVLDIGNEEDDFTQGEDAEGYKSDVIPKLSPDDEGSLSNLINPLVIYEEVRVGNNLPAYFMFTVLLEAIVVYMIYRRVDRKYSKK